jgi:uncharacterized protein YukE
MPNEKYVTKKDLEDYKVVINKVFAQHIAANMSEFKGLQDNAADLADAISDIQGKLTEFEDRLDKLETGFAQARTFPSLEEWTKAQNMMECIHSIGNAIRKYNGGIKK